MCLEYGKQRQLMQGLLLHGTPLGAAGRAGKQVTSQSPAPVLHFFSTEAAPCNLQDATRTASLLQLLMSVPGKQQPQRFHAWAMPACPPVSVGQVSYLTVSPALLFCPYHEEEGQFI
ncbi:PDGF-and VEGF-receptor isoform A [Micractinium conductrix]|uniref:PDGF-and VEGF-receptor isoform A n=1 Tax=Micractinium conductrix TaxID=554055 RepID=A0A2P6VGP6_9CHLO|nr:PDGF-and VEGF-receptor isoform A [Micractinium conductrix]|eukprot:PSC73247.1 PDGF-and VEGF-receptor isoform A [Micractinium conductrix]